MAMINTNYTAQMMQQMGGQMQLPPMLDMSALTGGTIPTNDTASLSKVLGDSYTDYQKLLSSSGLGAGAAAGAMAGLPGAPAAPGAEGAAGTPGTPGTSGAEGTAPTGLIKFGEDKKSPDFSDYLAKWFPNMSEEERNSVCSYYADSTKQMMESFGKCMDMSNLAQLATGMNMSGLAGMAIGQGGLDMDSILKQTKDAGNGKLDFDVSTYLKTYFPQLSASDASKISEDYTKQAMSLLKHD